MGAQCCDATAAGPLGGRMPSARGLGAEGGLEQTARCLGGRLPAAVRVSRAISSSMSRRLPATGEDRSGSSPSASWWDSQPRFCFCKWGTETLQCRRRPTRRCRFLRDRRTMLAALPRPERPCAAPRVAALPVSRHASPHFRYLAQLCLVSFVSVSRHHGGRCIGARSSPQARWGTFTLGSTPPTPGDAAAGSAGGPPRDR